MKFLAVIGNPISHSKSPRIHNNAIKALGLDGIYSRFLLKNENELKESLLNLKLNGANITLPFKEQALKIADFKDDFAKNIGSANTLIIKENKIHAFNTDAPGFLKAIEEFKNVKKAFILGAGGTAKAIAYALKQQGIKLIVANRSKERFKDFSSYECTLYKDLKECEFDLVINTTSAGLNDTNLPCEKALLEKIFSKAHYAFDAIYGKETPFLNLAKNFKVQSKDGKDMLLWQGVFAFELFFELHNKQDTIKTAMQEALNL